jgi:hypothetical protein
MRGCIFFSDTGLDPYDVARHSRTAVTYLDFGCNISEIQYCLQFNFQSISSFKSLCSESYVIFSFGNLEGCSAEDWKIISSRLSNTVNILERLGYNIIIIAEEALPIYTNLEYKVITPNEDLNKLVAREMDIYFASFNYGE